MVNTGSDRLCLVESLAFYPFSGNVPNWQLNHDISVTIHTLIHLLSEELPVNVDEDLHILPTQELDVLEDMDIAQVFIKSMLYPNDP